MQRFFILITLLISFNTTAQPIIATIEKITDGDTVRAITENGELLKVRLYGVDAPERKQAYGPESTQFVINNLSHKVIIEPVTKDHYRRMIAMVYSENDNTSINEKLISHGAAWVYSRYCKIKQCQQWKQLQAQAKNSQIGLWQNSNPTPPWKYRRKKKSKRNSLYTYR